MMNCSSGSQKCGCYREKTVVDRASIMEVPLNMNKDQNPYTVFFFFFFFFFCHYSSYHMFKAFSQKKKYSRLNKSLVNLYCCMSYMIPHLPYMFKQIGLMKPGRVSLSVYALFSFVCYYASRGFD